MTTMPCSKCGVLSGDVILVVCGFSFQALCEIQLGGRVIPWGDENGAVVQILLKCLLGNANSLQNVNVLSGFLGLPLIFGFPPA